MMDLVGFISLMGQSSGLIVGVFSTGGVLGSNPDRVTICNDYASLHRFPPGTLVSSNPRYAGGLIGLCLNWP